MRDNKPFLFSGEVINDFLNSEKFYDLMQDYRHAYVWKQAYVVECFEKVKDFIRQNLTEYLEGHKMKKQTIDRVDFYLASEVDDSRSKLEAEIIRYRKALEIIKTESGIAGRVFIHNIATVCLAVHLCDSCSYESYEFPSCKSGEITFGIDLTETVAFTKDADKVISCEGYSLKKEEAQNEPKP